MNEQQNVELVQRLYAAFGQGDFERVFSCMSPDIAWTFPAAPTLPIRGTLHGRDQVAEHFRINGERQSVRAFQIGDFVAQGDKVIVQGHGAWTERSSGREFDSDWVHIFTIAGGQIVGFREFIDGLVPEDA